MSTCSAGRSSSRLARRAPALACGAGILVALALAVVATRRAPITEHSPITPAGGWQAVWIAALSVAFVLYVVALLFLRGGGSLHAVLLLAAAIQLAPLAAPLLLSTDVYS